MPRLAGKVAFVTGAGTGIGRATAILFAREGARVAIAEIDPVSGEETAHLAGNGAIAIRTDVTDPESLERAIRAVVAKFGGLHVLHNNAGGSTAADNTAVEAPLDEFWRAIKLDLYGTFLGCRFGIPVNRQGFNCAYHSRDKSRGTTLAIDRNPEAVVERGMQKEVVCELKRHLEAHTQGEHVDAIHAEAQALDARDQVARSARHAATENAAGVYIFKAGKYFLRGTAGDPALIELVMFE
jgi:hypothetical protein